MAKDGTKGYRFSAMIYGPILERGLRAVREKTAELSGVKAGDKVLEVCCGTGKQAEVYALTGAQVEGMDLSEYMMARAKRNERENLAFTPGDATAMPYDDSSFDCSSTGFSLHEVSEEMKLKFLGEMRRVTKSGGSLIFTDFSVQFQNGFANRFFRGACHSIEWMMGGEHYRNYIEWMNEDGLAGFVSRNGLGVEDSNPLYGGYILVVKVKNEK